VVADGGRDDAARGLHRDRLGVRAIECPHDGGERLLGVRLDGAGRAVRGRGQRVDQRVDQRVVRRRDPARPRREQGAVDVRRQGAQDPDVVLIVDQEPRRRAAIERQDLEQVRRVVRELARTLVGGRRAVGRERAPDQRRVGVDRGLGHRARERRVIRRPVGAIALEVEVRGAAVAVERRDPEVAIALRRCLGMDGRRRRLEPRHEPAGRRRVLDRGVEVRHHAPVAVALAQLGPADVEVDRRRARMGRVNDGRQRGRRRQLLRGLVVVVDLGDVDARAVEHRRRPGAPAVAAAVPALVATPGGGHEALGVQRLHRVHHPALERTDERVGLGSVGRSGERDRHPVMIRAMRWWVLAADRAILGGEPAC